MTIAFDFPAHITTRHIAKKKTLSEVFRDKLDTDETYC